MQVLLSEQAKHPLEQLGLALVLHYPVAVSTPFLQEVHFKGPAPVQVAQLLSQAVQRLKVPKYPSLQKQV